MTSITDADKAGFMNAVYKMKKEKGLDLLLHTPGGNLAATESIGQYLKDMFHPTFLTLSEAHSAHFPPFWAIFSGQVCRHSQVS